jgi:hypothetical protein
MDLSDDEVQQRAEAARREVDPPLPVETATWSKTGQLDWSIKETGKWMGRVRGADGRQRWIRAVDLRPMGGSSHDFVGVIAASRWAGSQQFDA